jgi:hypothetical protein
MVKGQDMRAPMIPASKSLGLLLILSFSLITLDDTDVKGQPNQTDHERLKQLAMEDNAAREESRMQVKKEWAEWMPAATNSYMEISPTYPDRAFLLIQANGSSYTATIRDSGHDTTTKDGTGNNILEFECSRDSTFDSTFALSVQKQGEPGILNLAIVQNDKVIDSERTEATDGIVSLSGICGKVT